MSVISPRSSEIPWESPAGFTKPMPKRGHDSRIDQGDSAEFDVDVMRRSSQSALELWRKLQPDVDDPDYSAHSCSGVVLGHFRVEERIGRGGMGAVFRAVDTRLDREVAIKVLAGTQSSDKSAVDRFQNEARAAARLDHDNVARVYFVGEEQGLHYIAFEFVHGANVREIIDARVTLSAAETVSYGLQIAHALRHVAAAGVVHRDVKPSNIIIAPTGRAKLVDLGLARKVDPEASKDLTVDGTTLGTFDYISPEQAKDPRNVDIRSDIYSLGCTMYHMLTGEPPYPKGTMLQKLLDHQHKNVPDAASRNGSVPPELSAVVRKMMASDPAERYCSADDLIGDLSILAHAYGLRPMAAGSLVWMVPPRPGPWDLVRRYRAWIATAALLVVGVLVFDAVQSRTGTTADFTQASGGPRPVASETAEPPHHSPPSTSPGENASPGLRMANGTLPGDVPLSPQNDPESVNIPSVAVTDPPAVFGPALAMPGIAVPIDGTVYQSPFEEPPSNVQPTVSTSEIQESTAVESDVHEDPVPAPPSPTIANLPKQPFLVRVDDADVQGYLTLEAACNAAPDGGVIELNFDGRLSEPQRPIRISGKRLRLRRSSGRSPIVRFAVPQDWTSAEVVRMISVTRGALEVYDIGIELDVDPTFFANGWSLFSLSQVDEVILRGVSVTLRNGNQHPAAIVELAESSPRFDDRMPDAMEQPPLRFEADDCFFRGEADLFLSESVAPVRVRFANVAVAIDGSLIHLRGVEAIDVLADMNDEHRVELDLRHITALVGTEFVQFHVEPGKSVPRVAVSANNSILVSGAGRPLVSMSGEIDVFDAQDLLEWSGDHSYVQTSDPVWRIIGPTDEQDYDLAEWNELWKQGRLERPIGTNLLRRDRSVPYGRMTAENLALVTAEPALNPAVDGASDGSDAGVQWGSLRMPLLPEPSSD